jgi:hypothetical protein
MSPSPNPACTKGAESRRIERSGIARRFIKLGNKKVKSSDVSIKSKKLFIPTEMRL